MQAIARRPLCIAAGPLLQTCDSRGRSKNRVLNAGLFLLLCIAGESLQRKSVSCSTPNSRVSNALLLPFICIDADPVLRTCGSRGRPMSRVLNTLLLPFICRDADPVFPSRGLNLLLTVCIFLMTPLDIPTRWIDPFKAAVDALLGIHDTARDTCPIARPVLSMTLRLVSWGPSARPTRPRWSGGRRPLGVWSPRDRQRAGLEDWLPPAVENRRGGASPRGTADNPLRVPVPAVVACKASVLLLVKDARALPAAALARSRRRIVGAGPSAPGSRGRCGSHGSLEVQRELRGPRRHAEARTPASAAARAREDEAQAERRRRALGAAASVGSGGAVP